MKHLSIKRLMAGAVFTATVVGISGAASAASITGKWRGNGVATLESGNQERVRCQVTYGRIAGQDFSLNARCASGAGRLSQVGTLTRVANNRYVGRVQNKEYSVSAKVTITVQGAQQRVQITSAKGSASLNLTRR